MLNIYFWKELKIRNSFYSTEYPKNVWLGFKLPFLKTYIFHPQLEKKQNLKSKLVLE